MRVARNFYVEMKLETKRAKIKLRKHSRLRSGKKNRERETGGNDQSESRVTIKTQRLLTRIS